MTWKFGVRRHKNGKLLITEEYGKNTYAVVGVMDGFSPKEVKLIGEDLMIGKIKKDNGTGLTGIAYYYVANPIEDSLDRQLLI